MDPRDTPPPPAPTIKIVSPKFGAARLRRLRFSWFLMGGACGMLAGWSSHMMMAPAAPTVVIPPPAIPAPPQASDAAPAMPMFPASVSLRVGSGDTLLTLLTDTGVSYDEAHEAVRAIRQIFDPRRLDVGSQVAVMLAPSQANPAEPTLGKLSMPISKTALLELRRDQKGAFSVKKIETPVEKTTVKLGGTITSSFYQTGINAGIPADVLADLIKVYSYDVDFQRDIQRGNALEVLMERVQTKDGIVTGFGNVLYASLTLDKRKLAVYRYTDKAGNTDYYNEKGESLRKALLRTPINGAKITSRFGMRQHPILGYSKMHRGVDFGAQAGTPIYAAGDGVVEMAGWNAGYGNYVRIKHNGKYSTAYGHASRIATGIKKGKQVRQGQVIAYVGSTGQSTGPHLHYEVLAGGTQINPSGVKFKTGNVLSGKELASFKQIMKNAQVALAEAGKKKTAESGGEATLAKN